MQKLSRECDNNRHKPYAASTFSTSSDGLLFNQVKDNLNGGKIQQGLTLFNDYAAQSLLICAFIFSG
ncbi:hypothetical protein D088_580034 [Salmonella enterica subsp. houtenae serovar 16:z4,z32:-- str. RKS3027]|nr:hypothetical protein D088_580034 [Salmonella enterica subsp. houtenae serovar 16:z4,z32:-- str. RKS3027]